MIDHVEDNVDTLLARLQDQVGKKVKILTEEEEAAELERQKQRELKNQQEL